MTRAGVRGLEFSEWEIQAINVADRVAIAKDGYVYVITNLLDSAGEETDEADEAVVAVGQLRDGTWFVVALADFEPALVH